MSQLVYIVGASGVGKDALMSYARQKINGGLPVLFAHRYITRPQTEGSENHLAITPEEFCLRRDAGLFALYWESHGLYYGIGAEIDTWLEAGFDVVVNGSRQYLPVAIKRYPAMKTIIIEADPEVIRHRLESRGREDAAEISQRLMRKPDVSQYLEGEVIRISNNGPIKEGADALVAAILSF
jgi:ribose 1,5-bisphosphokinase